MLRPNSPLILAAAATVSAAVACTPKSAPSSQGSQGESSIQSTASPLTAAPTGPTPIADDVTNTLELPIPGSKGNPITPAARKLIVDAVLGAKKTYYDDKKYVSGSPRTFRRLGRFRAAARMATWRAGSMPTCRRINP